MHNVSKGNYEKGGRGFTDICRLFIIDFIIACSKVSDKKPPLQLDREVHVFFSTSVSNRCLISSEYKSGKVKCQHKSNLIYSHEQVTNGYALKRSYGLLDLFSSLF